MKKIYVIAGIRGTQKKLTVNSFNEKGVKKLFSLYIIKTFRRRRVKNRDGEGERGGGGGGRDVLSPPTARNFLVCSKFGFVRSLGLFEI